MENDGTARDQIREGSPMHGGFVFFFPLKVAQELVLEG